jgi:hypothetical protein
MKEEVTAPALLNERRTGIRQESTLQDAAAWGDIRRTVTKVGGGVKFSHLTAGLGAEE